jgi:hypothetical protein
MGNVDWSCLAIQVAITGIAFFLVNMLILYKDVDGKAPTIRRDDHNLFLSLLLSILVGYWATSFVKKDCISFPYTKQKGTENFEPGSTANDIADFNRKYNPKYMALDAISSAIPGKPLDVAQNAVTNAISSAWSWISR